jgi:hypothetical protein
MVDAVAEEVEAVVTAAEAAEAVVVEEEAAEEAVVEAEEAVTTAISHTIRTGHRSARTPMKIGQHSPTIKRTRYEVIASIWQHREIIDQLIVHLLMTMVVYLHKLVQISPPQQDN